MYKFDKIICLYTLTALLISFYLLKNYKKNYIIDFIDVSYEYNKIYKLYVKHLCEMSFCVFYSSVGFKKYLGKSQSFLVHNTTNYNCVITNKEKNDSTIIISFWGFIRQLDYNKKIIDYFSNDKRFLLKYYGFEQGVVKDLKSYVEEKKYSNILFLGQYDRKQIYKMAADCDFINNLYENDFSMINATSNKFYDSIKYCKPQLVQSGSLMSELVNEKFGFVFDICKTSKEDLIKYYKAFNKDSAYHECTKKIRDIKKDNENVVSIINDFLLK